LAISDPFWIRTSSLFFATIKLKGSLPPKWSISPRQGPLTGFCAKQKLLKKININAGTNDFMALDNFNKDSG
jgi:hypothetical protein